MKPHGGGYSEQLTAGERLLGVMLHVSISLTTSGEGYEQLMAMGKPLEVMLHEFIDETAWWRCIEQFMRVGRPLGVMLHTFVVRLFLEYVRHVAQFYIWENISFLWLHMNS